VVEGVRLTLLGLALGLQLAAHDVRVGTVVVDEAASRVGDVRQETGGEVEGINGASAFSPSWPAESRYVAVAEPGAHRRRARPTGLLRQ
jgi:hypothetical protein